MGIGDVESPHGICPKLVGGFSPPIWKIWKSMGRMILYVVENRIFMFETTSPSCWVTAAKAHEKGTHNETKTQQSYLTCFQWNISLPCCAHVPCRFSVSKTGKSNLTCFQWAIVFQWLAFIQYIIHMLRYDMIWYDMIWYNSMISN